MYVRINDYGAAAVLGRALSVREARFLTAVNTVLTAYRSWAWYRDSNGQKNWAEWVRKYPQLEEILTAAEIEAKKA